MLRPPLPLCLTLLAALALWPGLAHAQDGGLLGAISETLSQAQPGTDETATLSGRIIQLIAARFSGQTNRRPPASSRSSAPTSPASSSRAEAPAPSAAACAIASSAPVRLCQMIVSVIPRLRPFSSRTRVSAKVALARHAADDNRRTALPPGGTMA